MSARGFEMKKLAFTALAALIAFSCLGTTMVALADFTGSITISSIGNKTTDASDNTDYGTATITLKTTRLTCYVSGSTTVVQNDTSTDPTFYAGDSIFVRINALDTELNGATAEDFAARFDVAVIQGNTDITFAGFAIKNRGTSTGNLQAYFEFKIKDEFIGTSIPFQFSVTKKTNGEFKSPLNLTPIETIKSAVKTVKVESQEIRISSIGNKLVNENPLTSTRIAKYADGSTTLVAAEQLHGDVSFNAGDYLFVRINGSAPAHTAAAYAARFSVEVIKGGAGIDFVGFTEKDYVNAGAKRMFFMFKLKDTVTEDIEEFAFKVTKLNDQGKLGNIPTDGEANNFDDITSATLKISITKTIPTYRINSFGYRGIDNVEVDAPLSDMRITKYKDKAANLLAAEVIGSSFYALPGESIFVRFVLVDSKTPTIVELNERFSISVISGSDKVEFIGFAKKDYIIAGDSRYFLEFKVKDDAEMPSDVDFQFEASRKASTDPFYQYGELGSNGRTSVQSGSIPFHIDTKTVTIISIGNRVIDDKTELEGASISVPEDALATPLILLGEATASTFTFHPGVPFYLRLNVGGASNGLAPEEMEECFNVELTKGGEYVEYLGFMQENYENTSRKRSVLAFKFKTDADAPADAVIGYKVTKKECGVLGTAGQGVVTGSFTVLLTKKPEGVLPGEYNLMRVGRTIARSQGELEPERFGYYSGSTNSAAVNRYEVFETGRDCYFVFDFEGGDFSVPMALSELNDGLYIQSYDVLEGDASVVSGFSLKQALRTSTGVPYSMFLVMSTYKKDLGDDDELKIKVRLASRNDNRIGGVKNSYVDVIIKLKGEYVPPKSGSARGLTPINRAVDLSKNFDISSIGYRNLSKLTGDVVANASPRIARYDPEYTPSLGYVVRENPASEYTPGETLYLRFAFKEGAVARNLDEMVRYKLELLKGSEFIEQISFEQLPYDNRDTTPSYRIFIAVKTRANVKMGSVLNANIRLTSTGGDMLGSVVNRAVTIPLSLLATPDAYKNALLEAQKGKHIRISSIGYKGLSNLPGDVVENPAPKVGRFEESTAKVLCEMPITSASPGETLYLRLAFTTGYSASELVDLRRFLLNIARGADSIKDVSFVKLPYDNNFELEDKFFIAVKLRDELKPGTKVSFALSLTASGHDQLGGEPERTVTIPLQFSISKNAHEEALAKAKRGTVTNISYISGREIARVEDDTLTGAKLAFYNAKKHCIYYGWSQLAYTPGSPIYIRLSFSLGMSPERLEALPRKYSLSIIDENGVIRGASFTKRAYFNGSLIKDYYFIALRTSEELPKTKEIDFTVKLTTRGENSIGGERHRVLEIPIHVQARGWPSDFENAEIVKSPASESDYEADKGEGSGGAEAQAPESAGEGSVQATETE